jgi:hypothetical protein
VLPPGQLGIDDDEGALIWSGPFGRKIVLSGLTPGAVLMRRGGLFALLGLRVDEAMTFGIDRGLAGRYAWAAAPSWCRTVEGLLRHSAPSWTELTVLESSGPEWTVSVPLAEMHQCVRVLNDAGGTVAQVQAQGWTLAAERSR